MIKFFAASVLLLTILASCKYSNVSVIDVKPNSLFIEPDSINHNYVDPVLLKTFFAEFPHLQMKSEKVLKFYEKRNFQYAWFGNSGLNEQGRLFINLIKNHNHEGVYDSIPCDSLMNNWYTQFIDTTVFTDSIAPHFCAVARFYFGRS